VEITIMHVAQSIFRGQNCWLGFRYPLLCIHHCLGNHAFVSLSGGNKRWWSQSFQNYLSRICDKLFV